ncbi:uncharacterized protein LOC131303092 [Rhododendron vialii]|uniref:uncharacterized protein LOC131303092 n=1 Tax=Rhododendron vialii TaxID=182163 RepID=UPI00265FB66E|nr:uncharacterized protein LOC131303092 [Rhododendron vialii]
MSVSKYDRIFTDLSRFAPHMVDTDAHRARRFEEGLKDGLHEPIKLLRLQTYADILNVALLSEEDRAKSKAKAEGQKRQTTFVPVRNQGVGGSFKRQNMGTSGWSQGGSSSNNSGGSRPCPKCGRAYRGQCYRDTGACFRYGQIGHLMKDCPAMTKPNVRTPTATTSSAQSLGTKPAMGKKQGKVFALVPGDSQNANSVVSGTLQICGHSAYVLIDSGSTHSFVSMQFAAKLTRPLEPLDHELHVSQPMGGNIECSTVYKACDILVGGAYLLVDLIPLNMGHFDAILGMDWLTSNFATIDCIAKTVMIQIPNGVDVTFEGKAVVSPPYLISAMRARKLIGKGCQGYL